MARAGRGARRSLRPFPYEGGVEKNRRAIHEAVRSALAAAGADPSDVASVGLGLTGAPPRESRTPIVDEIVREILPAAIVTVVPDYVTNLAGASGGEPGVVLIAGGGSIGYGVTADGREALAADSAICSATRGAPSISGCARSPPHAEPKTGAAQATSLRATVLEHFDIATMRAIPRVVYRAGFAREQISLLAPAVGGCCQEPVTPRRGGSWRRQARSWHAPRSASCASCSREVRPSLST